MKKEHRRGIPIPGRILTAGILIILQIALFAAVALSISHWLSFVYRIIQFLSMIMVIWIINKRDNPSYKFTWVLFILLAPCVGGVLFFLWGNGKVRPHLKKRMAAERRKNRGILKQDVSVFADLRDSDVNHSRQSQFLYRESGCPVYDNTSVEYLSPGEKFLPRMLEELQSAEKYIFLEYFILAKGEMWDSIHSILKEKAAAGVEVRIIFDDFGSISRQNRSFVKELRSDGIKVIAFNRIRASVDLFLNNRDHRKICVIDGYVSMTGGLNIADEYINLTHPHGYWMDSGVIMKGAASTTFVVAFCEMWNSVSRDRIDPANYIVTGFPPADGFVQPYVENPLDTDHYPAEGIYRQILGSAKDYVYIVTPYLILDNTMIASVTSAAKAGVDVRIITPKIRDKWYVHPVTQFNYQELLEAGVRIFEYTPGFIHSKTFVSDDEVATCGTVNMDYRSFYFHFECGVWFCKNDAVTDIKYEFLSLEEQSEEIILSKWVKRPLRQKLAQALLNIFAPFM